MSTAEFVIRILLAVVFFAIGAAVLLPMVGERYRPLAAAVVLVAGSTAVVIGVALRGGDRG
jgi:predicted MFS family arabinose efflux permease